MVKCVCIFAAVFLLAVSANALTCYNCPSGCIGDEPSKWNQTDCGPNPSGATKLCLKEVIQMKGSPDRIVRKCVTVVEKRKFECTGNPGENITVCETCSNENLCNSAGSFTFNSLLISSMVLPFLATILY